MGVKIWAAMAAMALPSAAAADVTVIWNSPQARTRADACSLLVSLERSPDPYRADKSASATRARKQVVELARRAHAQVCVTEKGDPEPKMARDGSVHFGRMIDGKPEGWGVRFYNDGSRYIGQWKAGLRQGEGMGLQANGARYVGHWDEDKPHGQGAVQYHARLNVEVAPPK